MLRLACARLRCRDTEYFYFDADGVLRYTSAAVTGGLGEQMCGATNTGWSEEVYSFHQKFSHTADELTLKVRARSVGAWAACGLARVFALVYVRVLVRRARHR